MSQRTEPVREVWKRRADAAALAMLRGFALERLDGDSNCGEFVATSGAVILRFAGLAEVEAWLSSGAIA